MKGSWGKNTSVHENQFREKCYSKLKLIWFFNKMLYYWLILCKLALLSHRIAIVSTPSKFPSKATGHLILSFIEKQTEVVFPLTFQMLFGYSWIKVLLLNFYKQSIFQTVIIFNPYKCCAKCVKKYTHCF